jgi:periplasmic divalent cation tolerance protein
MSETVVILCTCDSDAQAETIAAALVGERLAACVNILPPIRSIYRWKEVIEDARETLLLIKSTAARFAAIRDRIHELHSYETPEVIALPILAGSEKYLAWLREQVD